MPRTMLTTTLQVQNAPEGTHSVEGGLLLQVTASGRRSWLVRYTCNGKRREAGLGGFPGVSLKDARIKAAKIRTMAAEGVDYIEQRRAEAAAAAAPAVPPTPAAPSFAEVAADYLKAHAPSWKTEKQSQVWLNSLTTHAAPIWNKPVDAITRDDVLNLLLPIWHTKPETGNRVRMRIDDVLSAAIVRGLRPGPSPAAWAHGLDALLPSWKSIRTVEHHAALDWKAAPAFHKRLRSTLSLSALCLEWVLLSACRVGEAAGAEWREIDTESKIWTVPAARAKSGRPHRVPITTRMLAILEALPRKDKHLFPGGTDGHLNPESVRRCLQRDLAEPELTVHGFRSTFRDWAAAEGYPFDLAEQQLAHLVGDETVRAYYRGDALDRRAPMMAAWTAYLCGEGR
jgi:integrase